MIERISTHVLDTAAGGPGAGIAVTLRAGDAMVGEGTTDADGRVVALNAAPIEAGEYTLTFDTGPYFAASGSAAFYPRISVTVALDGARSHYHLPVLVSTFSYSTYLGELSVAIVLGPNQYGKAEVRLVYVDRRTAVHAIKDVNVTSQLLGDFTATHLTGANDRVIATDTQKNTVYGLARTGGVGAIEEFALRLARNFVDQYDYVSGARQAVEEFGWERISTPDGPHPHSFVKGSAAVRTALVKKDGDRELVFGGVRDLVVLKSTGSEFHGFPDVPFTSLVETDDRIMATSVSARWLYAGVELDWDAIFASVRSLLLQYFATVHSLSLQQTLFAMGRAVLEQHPEIVEIRFSMPNKHHFLVDLSAWGLDNPHQVFHAADRPYGLIEASVRRDDAPADPDAWTAVPGFL